MAGKKEWDEGGARRCGYLKLSKSYSPTLLQPNAINGFLRQLTTVRTSGKNTNIEVMNCSRKYLCTNCAHIK